MSQQSLNPISWMLFFLLSLAGVGLLQAQADTTFYYSWYDTPQTPSAVHVVFDASQSSFFSGQLSEYYENGQLKAQGEINNGWRMGSWKIWDANGSLIHQRTYAHPGSYVIDYPAPPRKGPAQLFNIQRELKRENSLIRYTNVKEYEVYWEKRLWLDLMPVDNPLLFEDDRLFQHLERALEREKPPRAYDGETDNFKYELSLEETQRILAREKDNIVGIRLKTIWFFSKITQCMDRRIIGLALLRETSRGRLEPILWFYYPEIRPLLAEIPVNTSDDIFPVQQLEDHFHFWAFNGQIVKESNVRDLYFDEYLTSEEELKNIHRDVLLNIYQFEHNVWQLFNQGQSMLDK
ncbi:MAG: hypothetical protein AAGJ93_14405 [Bacteroidota bacterium]